jgi:hypothetical protein
MTKMGCFSDIILIYQGALKVEFSKIFLMNDLLLLIYYYI